MTILIKKRYTFGLYTSLFIVLFSGNGFAKQNPKNFTDSYNFIRDSILPVDFQHARLLSDSLLKHATTENEKTQTMMLLAVISTQIGDQVAALEYALQAEKQAIKAKDYEWQVRAAGFLSAVFRDLNLPSEAIQHIRVAEKANENLKHLVNYPYVQFSIHGEKAAYHMENEDYALATEEFLKREEHINKISKADRDFFLVTHHNDLGGCYLGLKEYEEAKINFEKALDANQNSGNVVGTSIYRGLGEIAMHEMDYPLAFDYFKKAEEFLQSNAHYSAKILIYKSLADYYKTMKSYKEALHYKELYLNTIEEKKSATKEISNQLIERSLIERNNLTQRYGLLLGISVVLIVITLLLFVYISFLKKRARSKYDELMIRLNERHSFSAEKTSELVDVQINQKNTLSIPMETENALLEELKKMEEDHFFLDRNTSLSSLATLLRSNTKYVSHIINTHKKKDFNNYVNELRILYIIDKFQREPKYQSYKLAYIAEHCGFSSHSKFASIFKEVTGLSPSNFLSILKEKDSALLTDV